jgi:hypothetical protein
MTEINGNMNFESLKIEKSKDYVSGKGWHESIKGQIVTSGTHGTIILNLSEMDVKKIMSIVASGLVGAAENAAQGLLESCLQIGSVSPAALNKPQETKA